MHEANNGPGQITIYDSRNLPLSTGHGKYRCVLRPAGTLWVSLNYTGHINLIFWAMVFQGTKKFIYLAKHERRHPNERGRPRIYLDRKRPDLCLLQTPTSSPPLSRFADSTFLSLFSRRPVSWSPGPSVSILTVRLTHPRFRPCPPSFPQLFFVVPRPSDNNSNHKPAHNHITTPFAPSAQIVRRLSYDCHPSIPAPHNLSVVALGNAPFLKDRFHDTSFLICGGIPGSQFTNRRNPPTAKAAKIRSSP